MRTCINYRHSALLHKASQNGSTEFLKLFSSNIRENTDTFLLTDNRIITILPVAQWIMRWTPTPKTAGSTPAGQAISLKNHAVDCVVF